MVEILDQRAQVLDKSKSLRVDTQPEFADRLPDHWAYLRKVEIDFPRLGTPTENASRSYP